MKRFLYRFWQWTWGLPQTLVGALVTLYYAKRPHFWYQGAYATIWPLRSSMSLGMFLFLQNDWNPRSYRKLLAHEYGHTVQSLLLGPSYLLVIGLPSILWAGLTPFERLRRKRGISYPWLYTERWADYNGKKFAKKDPNLIKNLRTDTAIETQLPL